MYDPTAHLAAEQRRPIPPLANVCDVVPEPFLFAIGGEHPEHNVLTDGQLRQHERIALFLVGFRWERGDRIELTGLAPRPALLAALSFNDERLQFVQLRVAGLRFDAAEMSCAAPYAWVLPHLLPVGAAEPLLVVAEVVRPFRRRSLSAHFVATLLDGDCRR